MTDQMPDMPRLGLRRTGLVATLGIFGLVAIFGVWASTTVISGAIISTGQIAVSGKPRVIQSLDGGAVETLRVKDGDIVEQGDLLVRFDPELLKINVEVSQSRLAATLALRARLLAEQQGADELVFQYPDLPFTLPDTSIFEEGEQRIFTTRQAMLSGGRAQLTETLRQLDNQITGVTGQVDALKEQITLVDRDLGNMETLIAQGLARQSQLSELERSSASLAGDLASQEAELARLSNVRRDKQLMTLQSERAFMEEVVTQLREVTNDIAELTLEIVTRQSQLDRVELRAPVSGIVHDLQIFAAGEVVPPGATILEIVPHQQDVAFELVIDPRAIDQVHPGQSAQVMLATLDPQDAARLMAEVATVSPDVIEDERSGQSFYRATLNVDAAALDQAGVLQQDLVPGMPINAFLQTGDRTVLAYLLHPITTHLRRAFRE